MTNPNFFRQHLPTHKHKYSFNGRVYLSEMPVMLGWRCDFCDHGVIEPLMTFYGEMLGIEFFRVK